MMYKVVNEVFSFLPRRRRTLFTNPVGYKAHEDTYKTIYSNVARQFCTICITKQYKILSIRKPRYFDVLTIYIYQNIYQ